MSGNARQRRRERRAYARLWDDAPYVCPGCYAIGEEPCLPHCDAAIERDRQRAAEDDWDEYRFGDDWGESDWDEAP